MAPELLEKPEVFPDLEYAWEGFLALSGKRQWQLGFNAAMPMPITMEAIHFYADRFALGDFEEFLELVTILDEKFLSWCRDRMKK